MGAPQGKKHIYPEVKLTRRNIDLLLNLRINGWSYNALASFFGIKRQGARYQCEKYGIYCEDRGLSIPFLFEMDSVWNYEDGEKVNKGRNYADYLKIEEERSQRNRFPSFRH